MVIVGGGLGGCAAALAALGRGLTRRHDRADRLDRRPAHVAGRAARRASLDRAVRRQRLATGRSAQGIRDYYRRHYPLTAEARAEPDLNPGNGGVSRLCHEPRVALAVLTAMLAPLRLGRAADWSCWSTSRSRAEVAGRPGRAR